MCASINEHTKLRDIWRHLRFASKNSPKRQLLHLHAEDEANRLINNFAARSSSENITTVMKEALRKLLPFCTNLTIEACDQIDDTANNYA